MAGMSTSGSFERPPFCPNEECAFHQAPTASWRWIRAGFFRADHSPRRIQRFRCVHCGRYFSAQTFRLGYWLRRPELLEPTFHDLVQCAGFRQIARQHHASPQTVARHAARLARHCQLFHEGLRPKGELREPQVLDGFQSFEYSPYHPTLYHLMLGKESHFWHGFTDTELRRSGRMSRAQKRRRAELERAFGRPDPRAAERDGATLVRIVAPEAQTIEVHSDEHPDYPRAFRRLPHLVIVHRTISSRAARTSRNPLFAVNLADALLRHCSANHKRETIAFSKRRQSAVGRMWVFLVWRNYHKWFSERHPGETPAMRLGVCTSRWGVTRILARRLFKSRIALPARWEEYYWGRTPTRRIRHPQTHRLKYAA
jgi:hypothetical protein